MIVQHSPKPVCRSVRAARLPGLTLVVGLALGAPAHAQLTVLTFEDIPGMPNGSGQPIPAASRLADQYLGASGVRFSSGSSFVAVVTHGANTPSGTRVIGGSTTGGALTYSNAFPIVATFLDPAGTLRATVSTVSVRGDLSAVAGTKTLEAFDVNGTLIGTQTLQDSNTAPLTITVPGIHRVRMYSSSGTVGFDDLTFDRPTVVACGPACPADVNCSGGVSVQDIFDFLTAYFAASPAADFNHSGGPPTVQDIFDFINAFFAAC
jgi:hypothetical protein